MTCQRLNINDTDREKPVSDFLSEIVVELDPAVFPENNLIRVEHLLIFQWIPGPKDSGFEVTRKGSPPVHLKLRCSPAVHLGLFTTPPALANIVSGPTCTRAEVLRAVWLYIKFHRLLDASQQGLETLIPVLCDVFLTNAFQAKGFPFAELVERVDRTLGPAQPFVVSYTVSADTFRREDVLPVNLPWALADDPWKALQHLDTEVVLLLICQDARQIR